MSSLKWNIRASSGFNSSTFCLISTEKCGWMNWRITQWWIHKHSWKKTCKFRWVQSFQWKMKNQTTSTHLVCLINFPRWNNPLLKLILEGTHHWEELLESRDWPPLHTLIDKQWVLALFSKWIQMLIRIIWFFFNTCSNSSGIFFAKGDGANWVKNGYQLLKTNWTEIKSITNQANFLFTCPNELWLVSWPLLDIFKNFIWLLQMCERLPQTKKSSSWSKTIKWRATSTSRLLLASVYVDAAFFWKWNKPIVKRWLLVSCNISQLSSVNDNTEDKT